MTFHLRRAKIVATLGPATDDLKVINDMVRAGVDVVRVNFSHGVSADHARRLELVRSAAQRAGRYVGVLGDLQGPKIRIDRFASGKVELIDGADGQPGIPGACGGLDQLRQRKRGDENPGMSWLACRPVAAASA